MRFMFMFSAFLFVLSTLLLIASVLTETLDGRVKFIISGSELTVKVSGVDSILLSVAVVSIIFALYFWQRLSGRE